MGYVCNLLVLWPDLRGPAPRPQHSVQGPGTPLQEAVALTAGTRRRRRRRRKGRKKRPGRRKGTC